MMGGGSGVLLQLLHERDAVDAGHHDVEQDHVEGLFAQHAQRLGAVGRDLDGVALAGEFFLEQPAERLFVVNDEDLDHNKVVQSFRRPEQAHCKKQESSRAMLS